MINIEYFYLTLYKKKPDMVIQNTYVIYLFLQTTSNTSLFQCNKELEIHLNFKGWSVNTSPCKWKNMLYSNFKQHKESDFNANKAGQVYSETEENILQKLNTLVLSSNKRVAILSQFV